MFPRVKNARAAVPRPTRIVSRMPKPMFVDAAGIGSRSAKTPARSGRGITASRRRNSTGLGPALMRTSAIVAANMSSVIHPVSVAMPSSVW